jgi:hypothetical protein
MLPIATVCGAAAADSTGAAGADGADGRSPKNGLSPLGNTAEVVLLLLPLPMFPMPKGLFV